MSDEKSVGRYAKPAGGCDPGSPKHMRKLVFLTLMSIACQPVLADDNDARIKTQVEDRFKEWVVAASKKDPEKQEDGSWKIFRYMFDEIPAKK